MPFFFSSPSSPPTHTLELQAYPKTGRKSNSKGRKKERTTVGCRSLPIPIDSTSGDAATIPRICGTARPSSAKNLTLGAICSSLS